MRILITMISFAFLLSCFNDVKAQNLLQNGLIAGSDNGSIESITQPFSTFQTDREHYWKKHKIFKTLGWVSIGVGIPLTLVGAVSSIASNDNPRVKKVLQMCWPHPVLFLLHQAFLFLSYPASTRKRRIVYPFR